MKTLLNLLAMIVLAGPALADEDARFAIGGDIFRAGQEVIQSTPDAASLFLAGERLDIEAAATGSAHLAGRWVRVSGAIGGNLYAAGQEVLVDAPVAGDATLFGQEVTSSAALGGNLRVFGSEVEVAGPVAGYLLSAGERVRLDTVVSGDMAVAARGLEFGPDARIEGVLQLYEQEPGTMEVPERVVPPDRIVRHAIEDWDHDMDGYGIVSGRQIVGGFLAGVLLIAVLAAVIAALAPETMADLRRKVLDQPFKTLATGFVTQSALIGSGVLLALTLIGLLLTPAMWFLVVVAGFMGYVVGAYALGVGLLSAIGRFDVASTKNRAVAAAVGALVAGLIGLIPLLGWICVLALSLAGTGAISKRMFRPALFVEG